VLPVTARKEYVELSLRSTWKELDAVSLAGPKEALAMVCGNVIVQLVELPPGDTTIEDEFRFSKLKSFAVSVLQSIAIGDVILKETFACELCVKGTVIRTSKALPLIWMFDREISELALLMAGRVSTALLPFMSLKVLLPAARLLVAT
jgi:hypothetical protein